MLKTLQVHSPSTSSSAAGLAELIATAQSGDREAFGELIQELDSELRAIAKRTVFSNRIDPSDVFQDAVLQAMFSIGDLRQPTRGGFLRWFSGIARNRVLTLRSNASRTGMPNKKTPYPWLRMEQLAPEQPEPSTQGALDAPGYEEEWPLALVMSQLTAVQRMGWLMREVFGMDWNTMALVMGKGSPSAARQSHYRALQSMQSPRAYASQKAHASQKPEPPQGPFQVQPGSLAEDPLAYYR